MFRKVYRGTLLCFASWSFAAIALGEAAAALLFDQWDREAGSPAKSILESVVIRAPLATLWGVFTMLLVLWLLHEKGGRFLPERPTKWLATAAGVVPVALGHVLSALGTPAPGLHQTWTENFLIANYLLGPALVFLAGHWTLSARFTSST